MGWYIYIVNVGSKIEISNAKIRPFHFFFSEGVERCNVVLLFCSLKEKDKLQNEILNKKKTLIYKKKTPTNIYCNE